MTPIGTLAGLVLLHLVVSVVHGNAHSGAAVTLSPASAAFVYVVILGGPLVGLGVAAWSRRHGAWIVAATMAGALVFGIVNHFVLPGPDHVAHVDAAWRTSFGVTAALLAIIEAAAVAVAIRTARLHTWRMG
jgi:hypothetical protein